MKFYFLLLAFALLGSISCNPVDENEVHQKQGKEHGAHEKAKDIVDLVSDKVKEPLDPVEENLVKAYTLKEFRCSSDAECGNGFCVEKSCVCSQGFVSLGDKACDYEQNTKLGTLVLSIFLGSFGADWFHQARGNSGYNWTAIFKLLLGILGTLGGCLICLSGIVFSCLKDNEVQAKARLIMAAFLAVVELTMVIWWFVDWIRILTDSFPDGNGVPLKSF